MQVLAFNGGSSSIKIALADSRTGDRSIEIHLSGIGGNHAQITVAIAGEARVAKALGMVDFDRAVTIALTELGVALGKLSGKYVVEAATHRIVHGGETFSRSVILDDRKMAALAELNSLAPLHNPPALAMAAAARKKFGAFPHVAVFDTAFHATLPARAREYALPAVLNREMHLRRYGFHGINHEHVMRAVAQNLNRQPQELRIVSCHLGNGASATAIEYGRSVETSMGMTPLEGLVMGTRSGDIDPGILLHLIESRSLDARALDHILNKESGLAGMTGTFDFAEIEQRAAAGDESCRRAISIYCHRVRKYIGAYAATMGGVDVIAFTGGIGEHSATARHRATQRLEFLGASLDETRNRQASVSHACPVVDVSTNDSRVRILVVRADEELQMAREAASLLDGATESARPVDRSAASLTEEYAAPLARSAAIPVAVSARHAHLTQSTIDALFGNGYQIRKRADLSQTGQFAAEETVTIVGPRGRIDHVRLMGPPRREDQIEISRSDEFVLGIDAPVRLSGDLQNSPGATLIGPRGQITIGSGVICARRHVHMSPGDAEQWGLKDHDLVEVRIDSDGRDLTFSDVIVRVHPSFTTELHLDTDEANAAGVISHQHADILLPTKLRGAITRSR